MSRYFDILVCTDIVQTTQAWAVAIKAAQRYDVATGGQGAATLALLEDAYLDYQRQMDRLAIRVAHDADSHIRRLIASTAKRPEVNKGHKHLRELVRSEPRPGPLGFAYSVGIANLNELEKATNPFSITAAGQVPYWKAQEFGSDHLVGSVIRGFFFDAGMGNPSRPIGGASDDSVFLSGPAAQQFGLSPRGGQGGLGTIAHPIHKRLFLTNGTAQAAREWQRGIRQVEARSVAEIRAVTARPRTTRTRGLPPARRRRGR